MKILAFIFMNCFFVAANVVAAVVVLACGRVVLVHFPGIAEDPWVWYLIGALALACALFFCVATVKLAQRSRT